MPESKHHTGSKKHQKKQKTRLIDTTAEKHNKQIPDQSSPEKDTVHITLPTGEGVSQGPSLRTLTGQDKKRPPAKHIRANESSPMTPELTTIMKFNTRTTQIPIDSKL